MHSAAGGTWAVCMWLCCKLANTVQHRGNGLHEIGSDVSVIPESFCTPAMVQGTVVHGRFNSWPWHMQSRCLWDTGLKRCVAGTKTHFIQSVSDIFGPPGVAGVRTFRAAIHACFWGVHPIRMPFLVMHALHTAATASNGYLKVHTPRASVYTITLSG